MAKKTTSGNRGLQPSVLSSGNRGLQPSVLSSGNRGLQPSVLSSAPATQPPAVHAPASDDNKAVKYRGLKVMIDSLAGKAGTSGEALMLQFRTGQAKNQARAMFIGLGLRTAHSVDELAEFLLVSPALVAKEKAMFEAYLALNAEFTKQYNGLIKLLEL